MIDIAPRAAVPFAVVSILAVARKYVRPAEVLSDVRIADLDSRFRRIRIIVGVGMICVAGAFAWMTHYLLLSASRYSAVADAPDAAFRLGPQSAIWWFFPIFGALTFCWEITLQLWSVVGDPQTTKMYRLWSDQRSGSNATGLLRWMGLLIAAPIGIATLLAVPMHATVRQDEIRVCGFGWSKCEVFHLAEAERLTVIDGFRDREGKLNRRAGVVIDFKGGRRWSSAEWGDDWAKAADPNLTGFLSKRTHLPLQYAQTERDITQTR